MEVFEVFVELGGLGGGLDGHFFFLSCWFLEGGFEDRLQLLIVDGGISTMAVDLTLLYLSRVLDSWHWVGSMM